MPTILLLDVSLSMCRTAQNFNNKDGHSSADSIELKQLANVGIGTLLDYFAQNAQLEQTALVVFSSLWEIRHSFTRHHESIKNNIYDLELYDKSNVINAVRGVLSLKLHEWVARGPINIILITDGQHYYEKKGETIEDLYVETSDGGDDFHDINLKDIEGQFDFPCKIQIVCLASSKEPALKYSIPFYKELISIIDSNAKRDCPVVSNSYSQVIKKSAIWLPESDTLDISIESVENLFSRLAETHYRPYHAILSCGNLSSTTMISPPPSDCLLEPLKNEFDDLKSELSRKGDSKETFVCATNKARLYKIADEISICGFLPLTEIASPAVTSRHLILPIVDSKSNKIPEPDQILDLESNNGNKTSHEPGKPDATSGLEHTEKAQAEKQVKSSQNEQNKFGKTATGTSETVAIEQDVTKQPSFCVLLHNSLKQENTVAICIVGRNEETDEDWYGMLHSHIDSKKRSSLMLSLLIPGPNPVLWLPSFKIMGSTSLYADLPQAIREKITNSRGPLKSYSSNNVIWLDPESVQADVQKIVRHAKRSPDKAPQFYKELNRIRRAAISYGFYDVLFGLAAILERERAIILVDQSKGVNQETLVHIDHVIKCLRKSLTEGSYDTNITPPSVEV